MRMILLMFFLFFVNSNLFAGAKEGPEVSISPKGITSISFSLNGFNVKVEIKTHEVKIDENFNDENDYPYGNCSNCTGSKNPCVVVDNLRIWVNKNPVFVARSAYADLGDLDSGWIIIKDKSADLMLVGGDGAEAYKVCLTFDKDNVNHRTEWSLESEDVPTQETTYHFATLN